MCVEGLQAIVQLRGALNRGVLATKGHLKRLLPPATACDGGHPHWFGYCTTFPCVTTADVIHWDLFDNTLFMVCGAVLEQHPTANPAVP